MIVRQFIRWITVVFLSIVTAYSIAVHWIFIAQVPDPIFCPDSGGYIAPALARLAGKPFALDPERGPCYPLFLYGILKITHRFIGVLIVQHSIALATGVLAAVIYYSFFKKSYIGAALVFLFSAALPLPAIYAHYILSETLYTFLLMSVVFLFLAVGKSDKAWLFVFLGFLIACSVLTRSVGRSLFGVLIFAPFLRPLSSRKVKGVLCSILCGASILVLFSWWNFSHFGFFGLDRMKSIAFFCTTARYLDPAKLEDERVRKLLGPIFQHHSVEMADGAWVYSSPQGPYHVLLKDYSPDQANVLFDQLAWMAIRQHPFRFLADRIKISIHFFEEGAVIPPYYLIPEASYFVYLGIELFEEIANDPNAWRLLKYGPVQADNYFAQVHYFPTGRPLGKLSYVPRSSVDLVYRFDRVLSCWTPLNGLLRHMQVLPCVALISALVLYSNPRIQYDISIVLLTIGWHVIAGSMAAFQDSRFIVPLLPLLYILVVGGAEHLISKCLGGTVRTAPMMGSAR